jgi:hypothetical protein
MAELGLNQQLQTRAPRWLGDRHPALAASGLQTLVKDARLKAGVEVRWRISRWSTGRPAGSADPVTMAGGLRETVRLTISSTARSYDRAGREG